MAKGKKTFYVTIERQGNAEAVVKVDAQDEEEAYCKAARAILASYDFSSVTRQQAATYADESGVYVIDEKGTETDL